MTPEQYQELLFTTAPPSGHVALVSQRLGDKAHTELLHAQLGITTEAGEFADVIKKYLFYGRAIDRINLIEELGDLTWYIGLAIQAIDSTWGEVFKANIKKLAARYPERFKEHDAIYRDLEKERKVLEDATDN
jgi:NTP pyrophosphatase (non-canonical NTP hydrolase)